MFCNYSLDETFPYSILQPKLSMVLDMSTITGPHTLDGYAPFQCKDYSVQYLLEICDGRTLNWKNTILFSKNSG